MAIDITTVLLVDSQGRSSLGRFLSVKPEFGVLTSTARTFIQEGVTTQYATQVLGTTLDNGRLYAHLLTKSSRVLYDNDSPTKSLELNNKKWLVDDNVNEKNIANYVKNTDYITPNRVDTFLVFPTAKPKYYKFVEKESKEIEEEPLNDNIESESNEDSNELLKSAPSNNPRVPYGQRESDNHDIKQQNNVKVYQIYPQYQDTHSFENAINHKDNENEKQLKVKGDSGVIITPSKIRPLENIPTITVRNEFSPSGFAYLGDLPDFDISTESNKPTTVAERKAKLLFRGGKPNKYDLKTVTYTGFSDFTTTVGDTVIVFSPQTSEVAKASSNVEPTKAVQTPQVGTTIRTYLSQEPGMQTHTIPGHKLDMHSILATMVIDAANRTREPKNKQFEEKHNEDAKLAVLAKEQKIEFQTEDYLEQITQEATTEYEQTEETPEDIQPSEAPVQTLRTPSPEDIAKILAALHAKTSTQATEPLPPKPSTVINQLPSSNVLLTESTSSRVQSGTKTIFFDDAAFDTNIFKQFDKSEEDKATTSAPTTQSEITEDSVGATTQNNPTTTDKEFTNEIFQDATTNAIEETTPELVLNEIDAEKSSPEENSEACTSGKRITPTTVYQTLTYLTTFYIPDEDTTKLSIKSNVVVSPEIGFETRGCNEEIAATSVVDAVKPTSTTEKRDETTTTESLDDTTLPQATTQSIQTTTEQLTTTNEALEEDETTVNIETTTPTEITTERRHVTESDAETVEDTTESGEEVELLVKTLYTTYTYLTTYFQDSTSSIESRKVVITNVISSTIDPINEASDPAIAGLLGKESTTQPSYKSKPITFEDFAEIAPTSVGIGRPTSTQIDNGNDAKDATVPQSVSEPTPALSNENLQQTINAVKTYYTTYTYFTTIFVDDQSEVSSRTEVYTNYVTPSIQASAVAQETDATATIEEGDEQTLRKKIMKLNIAPSNTYSSTITRQRTTQDSNDNNTNDVTNDNIVLSSPNSKLSYSTLQRTTTEQSDLDNNLLNLSEYETISTMVTDVRSSTSEGNRTILANPDKRNVLFDDQIVSESNNESEILPSPTLLLQTSYTTFTYFTTVYQGTTASNVVSRLETIMNVVTETLSPTHTLTVEDLSLPVTYFTTFTYWTTLYKDGTTKTRSRKETISNVVTPTASSSTEAIVATPILETFTPGFTPTSTAVIEPTKTESADDELTTYYTTYTYRTTSYVGNSSVVNSRFETVTSVINKTDDIEANNIASTANAVDASRSDIEQAKDSTATINSTSLHPTGLLSTVVSTVENSGTKTILSTDIFGTYVDGLYAKVLESTSIIVTDPIAPTSTSVAVEKLKPTGVVSIHKGKIVDAESVSTLFYTTQAVGTYIDNQYAQVIESTSSLKVDEERKAALPTDYPVTHRTGLVRLIEGSIIQNRTTTLYQSKVLGTVIDGRYAQIIESTSSFIVDKVQPSSISPTASGIAPTATQAPSDKINPSDVPISPSPVVIESSLSDSTKIDEENTTETDEDDQEEEVGGSTRVKSRLTLKTRSRTFTPAIRPFVSRPRPTFAPKRKGSGPGGATTITRSDFTPTVTAIPASKSGSRFGGRKSSTGAANIGPTASGSRRFSRPKSSAAGAVSSGAINRNKSSGRIQPTAFGFGSSSRRGGVRSSSSPAPGPLRPSSSINNRLRIRPTAPLVRFGNANTVTPASNNINDDENDLTTVVTDESTGVTFEDADTTLATTESTLRRSQNPLLRFRRPPLSRGTTTAKPTTKANGRTTNKNGNRVKTTTAKPKSLYRPVPALQSRPRPGNGLFPRRGLFTTTTPAPEEEEEVDEELLDEEGEEEEDDTEYEGTNTEIQTEQAPAQNRRSDKVQIRPFNNIRRRTKRQTAYSRFRRPTSRTTTPSPVEEHATEKAKPNRLSKQRTTPRTRTASGRSPANKRVSPTKASTQGRSQFTLREKDASNKPKSNFRRPSSVTTNRRTTTQSSRPKAPRLRNTQVESKPQRKQTQNRGSNNRRRTSSRTRGNSEERFDNFVLPAFDGTITVTYSIPTEVSIPVINGQKTEYKNVITAKYSTEVLRPQQYTSTVNAFGKEITVLLSEATGLGANGATQITHFILNETPTTSVIFTPTYIRGHKTSFSHVIPSTAYGVEEVVNTIQPALSAQAPLANILLSQLLLGQIGLQQPNPYIPGVPGTPTTELVTKTTSYVTTVTSATSTVLPLTFRGKEILTTIVDSSVTVVTATEFLTETVTVTPTPGFAGGNQLNSLLVPLLLQQQQQPQPLIQTPANVFNLKQDQPFAQALYQESGLSFNTADEEDYYAEQSLTEEEITPKPKRKASRKKSNKKAPAPAPVQPTKETSIITLYVSGKVPGEFSTVLSTVFVENSRRKREIPVEPSKANKDYTPTSTIEYLDTFIMPTTKDVSLQSSEQSAPTESLESIIGDVSKHLVNDPNTKSDSSSKKYRIKYVKVSDSRSPLDTAGNFLVL